MDCLWREEGLKEEVARGRKKKSQWTDVEVCQRAGWGCASVLWPARIRTRREAGEKGKRAIGIN